jgi:7-carboxy-7-deazaguanine synthase
VLADRADYEWARQAIAERGLAGRCPIHLSPVWGAVDPAELAAWILADRLPVRLSLQLHKLLWGAEARGV